MNKNSKKKAPPPRICYICGKEMEDEDLEYIRPEKE